MYSFQWMDSWWGVHKKNVTCGTEKLNFGIQPSIQFFSVLPKLLGYCTSGDKKKQFPACKSKQNPTTNLQNWEKIIY